MTSRVISRTLETGERDVIKREFEGFVCAITIRILAKRRSCLRWASRKRIRDWVLPEFAPGRWSASSLFEFG